MDLNTGEKHIRTIVCIRAPTNAIFVSSSGQRQHPQCISAEQLSSL